MQRSYPQKPVPRLRALVIGIDQYVRINRLTGAVADANAISDFLRVDLSVPPERITNLRNEEATREAIIKAFQDLRNDANIRYLDPILIYYAGHGGEVLSPGARKATTQCLIPQDIWENEGPDRYVVGIPDYTLTALIYDLAVEKGNNITVIFDCCHSASSTRGLRITMNSSSSTGVSKELIGPFPSPPSSFRWISGSPEARSVPTDCLPELPIGIDANILMEPLLPVGPSPSTSKVEPDRNAYLKRGMRSHVLLAACKHGQSAYEKPLGGGGYFTSGLLNILRGSRLENLTYKDCMKKFGDQCSSTPGLQAPICEGEYINRFFFNASTPGAHPAFIPVTRTHDLLWLDAGEAQGISSGSKFSLHSANSPGLNNPPLATFIAQASYSDPRVSYAPSTVFLAVGHPEGFTNHDSGQHIQYYARLIEDAARPKMKLYCPNDLSNVLGEDFSVSVGASVRLVVSRMEADAVIHIDMTTGLASFAIRLEEGSDLTTIPHTIVSNTTDFRIILNSMAQWKWHLTRIPQPDGIPEHPFRDQIEVNFFKLRESGIDDYFLPSEENLNSNGVVNLIGSSTEIYALEVTNLSKDRLYLHPFQFSSADLSIRSLLFKISGGEQVYPFLEPGARLTIGCEGDDMSPLSFPIEGVTRDDYMIRIYITNAPADFDCATQSSPFPALSNHENPDVFWFEHDEGRQEPNTQSKPNASGQQPTHLRVDSVGNLIGPRLGHGPNLPVQALPLSEGSQATRELAIGEASKQTEVFEESILGWDVVDLRIIVRAA